MLILEGLDRTGKSTMAKHLRTVLKGWGYRQHTKPPLPPFEYFSTLVAFARPQVLVDRLHWSEQAYANTYRDGPDLEPWRWRFLELALMAQQARILLMMDDPERIISRWSKNEMHAETGVIAAHEEFRRLIQRMSSPYVSYVSATAGTLTHFLGDEPDTNPHYTSGFYDLVDDEVDRCLVAQALPPPHVGIGHTGGGGFLLLGEAINYEAHLSSPIPGLPWDRGPASECLWQSLEDVKVKWWMGYYTNAGSFSHPEQFEHLVDDQVRPRRVVALGEKAQKFLNACRLGSIVEVTAIEHPSYIARFQPRARDRYAAKLGSALSPWIDA
jgi:hypothetical protein